MTPAQLASLDLLASGLAGLINSFCDGNPPASENWDVLLYPSLKTVQNDFYLNQVLMTLYNEVI